MKKLGRVFTIPVAVAFVLGFTMKFVRLGLILLFALAVVSAPAAQQNVIRARAILHDAWGQEVGTVLFTQAPADQNFPTPAVDVVARVESLTPGFHGIHIHEIGTCDPPFSTAGGHFDPGPFGNSNPDANHPFHMGDLPNLEVNKGGVGHLRGTTNRITLTPGPLSIFDPNGSAVIIHRDPDQGTTGVPGGSGGPRIACGVIVLN